MHLQSPIPGWPSVLAHLPDGALLKAVDNPQLLREARQKWASLGRDPAQLITDYRHFNLTRPMTTDLAQARDQWRANWRRFVDRTYLEQYAEHVLLVEELNEYTDTGTVHDPAGLRLALTSARAAVSVWNDEFRGRLLQSADGGEGRIPAECRVVIGNVPVGNDVAREYYQFAVTDDAVLGVHPYTHWFDLERDAQDWHYHSGRWHYQEQAFGLRPLYAFTECGPYAGVVEGWRHRAVCDGRVELLTAAIVAWVKDLATTPAYAEGRILGPGAWFTSSADGQWEFYQLGTPELIAIADAIRPHWRPGKQETDVDAATRAKLLEHVRAMQTLLEAAWWQTLAPGASVRVVTPTWIYADAAMTRKNRQKDEGEVMQVWRSQAGPTWSGEAVCVFSSTQLELWAPAAALERV